MTIKLMTQGKVGAGTQLRMHQIVLACKLLNVHLATRTDHWLCRLG